MTLWCRPSENGEVGWNLSLSLESASCSCLQEDELEEIFLQFKAVIAVKLEGQGWPP